MTGINNDVMIQLDTKIDDDGEIEYNTVKQKGKFFKRGSRHVLMYEEIHDETIVIKNLITIQPDKVNIKRSGAVKMNQQFYEDKASTSYYEHPHGQIHMETITDSIDYQSNASIREGKLKIIYTVKLNGALERKHLLELTYKEEGL